MSTMVPSYMANGKSQPNPIGGTVRLANGTLILGSGKVADSLYETFQSRGGYLNGLVSFAGKSHESAEEGLTHSGVVGTKEKLFEIVERHRVQTIVVCFEDARTNLPIQVLLDFKMMGLEIVDGQQRFEEVKGRLCIDSLRPSALVFSTGFRRRYIASAVKRLMDSSVAIAALTFLAPFFAVVGLLIKLDSPGPVFYRQIRVGLSGNPFMIWKFRTMGKDAEKGGPRWAVANDSRISRVGKWLRKLRIDELPQLINVLKGEMSLVGPRPERPVFVQSLRESIPYYDLRHTVRPGVTGWAQVKFRYGSSAEDSHMKLQYDLYYVKHLSLFLDLQILLRTVRVVLLGEGAR